MYKCPHDELPRPLPPPPPETPAAFAVAPRSCRALLWRTRASQGCPKALPIPSSRGHRHRGRLRQAHRWGDTATARADLRVARAAEAAASPKRPELNPESAYRHRSTPTHILYTYYVFVLNARMHLNTALSTNTWADCRKTLQTRPAQPLSRAISRLSVDCLANLRSTRRRRERPLLRGPEGPALRSQANRIL